MGKPIEEMNEQEFKEFKAESLESLELNISKEIVGSVWHNGEIIHIYEEG